MIINTQKEVKMNIIKGTTTKKLKLHFPKGREGLKRTHKCNTLKIFKQ